MIVTDTTMQCLHTHHTRKGTKMQAKSDYAKLEQMYEHWEVLRILGECEYKETPYCFTTEFEKAKSPEEKQQVLGEFKGRMIIYRQEPQLKPYLEKRHRFTMNEFGR